MGCIRVDRIIEYLLDPLRKGLIDKDPYVSHANASLAFVFLLLSLLYDMIEADANDITLISKPHDEQSHRWVVFVFGVRK